MAIVPLEELPEDTKSESKVIPLEKLPEEKKEKFLPSSASEAVSEAGKVVAQGVVGLSGDLLDVGNKPVAEILSGEVGKNVELGALLQKNIDKRIKAFSMAGGFNADILKGADAETLHTKIGFPVPPSPETGLGKILGLSARITGNIVSGKVAEAGMSRLTSPRFKLPSSEQIESAIQAVDSNVQTAQEINKTKLETVKARTKFDEEMFHKVRDSEELSSLENTKADIAYQKAQEIHGKPGENGLAVKASQELNKKYWEEVQPFFEKELDANDVTEGMKTVLQKYGVLDGQGDLIKDVQLTPAHARALKLAEEVHDMKTIKAGDFKAKLEGTIGKRPGHDVLTQEIFQEAAQYVDDIKRVNTKFVADYQTRNAIYDKFNIFNKIGWRKGAVSIEPGAKMLENLADADPAKVNRDYLQMDDFLGRYTGESVSAPVKELTGKMIGIRDAAIERNFRNQANIDSLESRIISQEARSKENAASIKANLSDVAKLSKKREEFKKWVKGVGAVSAATTAATMVGGKAVEFAKKLIP